MLNALLFSHFIIFIILYGLVAYAVILLMICNII